MEKYLKYIVGVSAVILIVVAVYMIFIFDDVAKYTSEGEYINLTYNYNGISREYILYLPEGVYKDSPLVFVFHGYTSTAENIKSYANLKDLADENDFVVCYPQGIEDDYGMNHWNANLAMSEVDDVGFIVELVGFLEETYKLDESRTFTTGMSNGGFMSYALAMDAADTFEAMASVSGLMSYEVWDSREKAIPIPVLHFHGTADKIVPIDGSMSILGGWGGAPAVPEMIAFWADVDACENLEEIVIDENTTAYYYTSDDSDRAVWYYETQGFGHEWPIKGVNASFNATDVIWEFFSQY
ncbi:MAG: alpha/beta hydrolase-fold protein [Vallitaleaceae bacterium]|nr:alpha/beta hydrolase-fold protein [Vallitaleaceae bacterium]